jgi:hypothetical protein
MGVYEGDIDSIHLDAAGVPVFHLRCSLEANPQPGQYLLAYSLEDEGQALPSVIFSAGVSSDGFLIASSTPQTWRLGEQLYLKGPLGKGFALPVGSKRVALAAVGDTISRLAPLVYKALDQVAGVALFSDSRLPPLPPEVEAYPLIALEEVLGWADYLAVDIPLSKLYTLRGCLGLAHDKRLSFQAEVLVFTSMVCGGVAACGVCAVPTRRGWKQACTDGPVFDLNEIEW